MSLKNLPVRRIIAVSLQVAGIAALAVGVGIEVVWGGVLVGGAGLLLLGIAAEREGT